MFVTPAMCKGLEREYLYLSLQSAYQLSDGIFRSPLLEPGRTEFIFRPTKATITAYDRARLKLNERSRLAQQKPAFPKIFSSWHFPKALARISMKTTIATQRFRPRAGWRS